MIALVHHDLCFGCGQTNLFGLLLEVGVCDNLHEHGLHRLLDGQADRLFDCGGNGLVQPPGQAPWS